MTTQINPKDFIAWLTTQPNTQGSLYFEKIAQHYARYLQTTPPKLKLSLSADERNVFILRSPAEFECLLRIFASAPNY